MARVNKNMNAVAKAEKAVKKSQAAHVKKALKKGQ